MCARGKATADSSHPTARKSLLLKKKKAKKADPPTLYTEAIGTGFITLRIQPDWGGKTRRGGEQTTHDGSSSRRRRLGMWLETATPCRALQANRSAAERQGANPRREPSVLRPFPRSQKPSKRGARSGRLRGREARPAPPRHDAPTKGGLRAGAWDWRASFSPRPLSSFAPAGGKKGLSPFAFPRSLTRFPGPGPSGLDETHRSGTCAARLEQRLQMARAPPLPSPHGRTRATPATRGVSRNCFQGLAPGSQPEGGAAERQGEQPIQIERRDEKLYPASNRRRGCFSANRVERIKKEKKRKPWRAGGGGQRE